ncbi:ribonuclease H-like domain-containing protein [Tanacetum coccineum]
MVSVICELYYPDDFILTTSSAALLQQIIASLYNEFSMIDLGSLHYFMGIFVSRNGTCMFLCQRKYALEILKCFGSLQYLTFTRPDLSYAVQQVCLFMHDPREQHLASLKRILRYVRGTLEYGLRLFSASPLSSVGYFDADWAGCPTTRQSTMKVEYRSVANVVVGTTWLCKLLRELHFALQRATLVYYDNVAACLVRVLHVPSRYQFADIFTKGLSYALFDDL